MNKIFKKFFVLSLSFTLVLVNLCSISIPANDKVNETYEDEYCRINQTNNVVTIYEKSTKKEIQMTIENENEAILKYSSGKVKRLHRDKKYNICLENKVVLKPSVKVEKEKTSSTMSSLAKSGSWHYYQTIYYDTKTKGDIENIAYSIFSFCPYIGPVVAIAGIVKTAKNLGAKTLYVKVKQYYYTGYSKYKYENYFYSNKSRTKLIKHTTTYQKMW